MSFNPEVIGYEFQWPLRGRHLCDDMLTEVTQYCKKEFQWPLRGRHLCDATRPVPAMA